MYIWSTAESVIILAAKQEIVSFHQNPLPENKQDGRWLSAD